MPGGPTSAYELISPILLKCAAQDPTGGPCTFHCGPIGAGNYVKMVHNGIEYGDMQVNGRERGMRGDFRLATRDSRLATRDSTFI